MSTEELYAFLGKSGAQMALRLRRYDDEGKAPDGVVPRLESYTQMMYEHLRRQTSLPAPQDGCS